MKLDYFTIEKLEINQNSFFYNIMKDLSPEEKEEQRYFELFGYEKYLEYRKQQNFFILIQNAVDKFVQRKSAKKLRKIFKYLDVIQKYCLNIDKVIEVVQDELFYKTQNKNYLIYCIIEVVLEEHFKQKMSFRFLKQFISPRNIYLFYQKIVEMSTLKNYFEPLKNFDETFGGQYYTFLSEREQFMMQYYKRDICVIKQLYEVTEKNTKYFYFPSKKEPFCIIEIQYFEFEQFFFYQRNFFFDQEMYLKFDSQYLQNQCLEKKYARKYEVDGIKSMKDFTILYEQNREIFEQFLENVDNGVLKCKENVKKYKNLSQQILEINEIINPGLYIFG